MRNSIQKKHISLLNRRTFFLYLLKASLLSLVGWRLYKIQILDSKKYKTLSKNNQIDIQIVFPLRGEIFDRNKISPGEKLLIFVLKALNGPFWHQIEVLDAKMYFFR